MSTSIAFDTLAYAKKLKSVGFTEAQAEVQAESMVALMEERLATKLDVAVVRRDVKEIESNLKLEIEHVRRDMKEMEIGLKRDMKEMESGLKRDMKEMESGLKRDMKEMESGLKRDMKEMESGLKLEIEHVRRDMKEMESGLKLEIEHVRRDMKEMDSKMETRSKETDAKLKELELRMVIKLGAMILAAVGMLVTANRLWPIPVQYVPSATVQELPFPVAPKPVPPVVSPSP
ncbi:MAG: DUF1640 domain-containing protein [Magnetococcales bacterium]|nr:DUF1640 domain-containing protein [Magnetococcales bacterium]MBF0149563.1 DUF1640 domain-containing protein [Magnetococcales bacterium]